MKIAALTDPESAAGFRLAGLQSEIAADSNEARKVLTRMVQEGDYVLIGVSEALLPDPYQAVRREMHGRDLPILLSIPSVISAEGKEAEEHVRQMILSTMGHEIKL
jgi:V/A-type H+-transporting ATPase subunit F